MQLLDGKYAARQLLQELQGKVKRMTDGGSPSPCLAILLVEGDAGSEVYVRNKIRTAEETGIHTILVRLPHNSTEKEILEAVERLNQAEETDCFIVQLPLPEHIDEQHILAAVKPEKDADANIKKDAIDNLLYYCGVSGDDKAIVVTEKNIPLSLTADDIPEGAIVIDMGFTCLDAPDTDKGYRIVGDADTESIQGKASYLAPVPGGIGPVIIATLMQHTVGCRNVVTR